MIEPIAAAGDPRLADYTRVGDAAWLRARGLFVAEGRLVVARALALPHLRIRSVLVTEAGLRSLSIPESSLVVYLAPQDVLNAVTGFNFHRGCLALVERPVEHTVADLLATRHVLALEGINNPDNVGGIFRVAAAFGAGGVVLDPTAGDPLYRKAVRTSMGASLVVPNVRVERWPEALGDFRAAGFVVVALTPDRRASTIDAVAAERPERVVFVLGAEGPGLSGEVLSSADRRVRIPTTDAVDSLNVVVAAGITLSRFL